MWCGAGPTDVWSYAPCVFQTVGATMLLPVALVVAYRQCSLVNRLCRERSRRRLSLGTARFANALLTVLLIAIHVAWITVLSVPHPRTSPFEWYFNVGMVLSWLLTLGVLSWGYALWIPVRVRTVAVFGVVVYWGCGLAFFARYWRLLDSVEWVEWLGLGAIVVGSLASTAIIIIEQSRPPSEEEQPFIDVTYRDVENGDAKRGQSWLELFARALLYVWPKTWGLQFRVIVCIILLICVRGINLSVAIFYGKVINVLAKISTAPVGSTPGRLLLEATKGGFGEALYPWVMLYLIALFFTGTGTGTGSILSSARQYLFFPITQDAYRRISAELFSHVLNLDLKYHLERKTGEVIRVMDRGTAAIQSVLSTVVFNVGPQLVDMVIAIIYVCAFVQGWIGIIIIVTLAIYLPLTVYLSEMRRTLKQELNKRDNEKSFKATDALLNYETVKYFNNEDYEIQQFCSVVADYQKIEFKWMSMFFLLNVLQSLVMVAGMIGGILLCVRSVVRREISVGDVTVFLTLLRQLYAPLNFLGTYYRMIQNNATDMENMFDLMDQLPSIKDAPDAKPLKVKEGQIEFDDVSFSYHADRPILDGVSFKVNGGGSIAIVGSTGSGKSTVLRLLFRLYETNSGSVKIDGQNVDDVTQKSLQRAMSYVPQDTVLFNDTIMNNIRYGDVNASDEEVIEVAKMAAIHDKIVERFPAKYETVVGERGLRLSGGEKQRVAFARAMLKNTPILLLDEATSALDSITEKKLQEAMFQLRQKRTIVVVAHRLSTVMDADLIVVMRDGEVVEIGSHPQLVAQNGLYAEMWTKQQESSITNDKSFASMSDI
ncbi:hypothetical protein BSKO_01344 [Bryopsis sp. KO-2023]|nr:hypothetical protein BSKO_01344 [Bryopsis sp. KO-2023]